MPTPEAPPGALPHMLNGSAILPAPGDVESIVPDLAPRLSLIRRHLHAHPEVGMQEFETSRFIRQTLESEGFQVHGPVATTGLYVDVAGAHPGPRIGYRADIDALPIQDAKRVSYASVNIGAAHLCGHDAHTTVAIGVALALRARREQMHGSVRVFFQPNEEGMPSGAPLMIQDGVLDDVEAVYAIHVDPSRPLGRFGLSYGPVTAASDSFLIQIHGHGTGHTARPHEVVDTIWVASQIMNTLYQIVGRINDTRNSAVLAFGRIRGGSALNVIPEFVEFGGTLRCHDPGDRIYLREQIERTTSSISELYGAKVVFRLLQGAPAVINDPDLAGIAHRTIESLWGPEAVQPIRLASMGAEDFAHYLERVPGVLLRVGTSVDESTSYPLHDARFDISEDALPLAVQTLSQILLNHLYLSRPATG